LPSRAITGDLESRDVTMPKGIIRDHVLGPNRATSTGMPSAVAVFIQFDFRGWLHRQVGAVVCL